ncbi:hypothetical protein [Pontitalea aquivivens]|uniref:hypothetical protein n=1 Tax=Pontitalea aquivivens TaxID=3388663 RepID=UPI003970EB9E
MSIKARLKRLEKKVAATEAPPRLIGYSLDGTPMWNVEEGADGILRFVPRYTNQEFGERCRNQQADLMKRLAAYEAELTESEEGTVEHGKDTSPASVGFNDQLAPGAKPLKFRYETDASGTEWQIEVSTGQKWKV